MVRRWVRPFFDAVGGFNRKIERIPTAEAGAGCARSLALHGL